jgi:hypothetical protein
VDLDLDLDLDLDPALDLDSVLDVDIEVDVDLVVLMFEVFTEITRRKQVTCTRAAHVRVQVHEYGGPRICRRLAPTLAASPPQKPPVAAG